MSLPPTGSSTGRTWLRCRRSTHPTIGAVGPLPPVRARARFAGSFSAFGIAGALIGLNLGRAAAEGAGRAPSWPAARPARTCATTVFRRAARAGNGLVGRTARMGGCRARARRPPPPPTRYGPGRVAAVVCTAPGEGRAVSGHSSWRPRARWTAWCCNVVGRARVGAPVRAVRTVTGAVRAAGPGFRSAPDRRKGL